MKISQENPNIILSCSDVVWYLQVTISRLMKQLSEPAVLLAVQMYFPDILPLRLFSFSVPVFSSKTAVNMVDFVQAVYCMFICMHMDITTENQTADASVSLR